MKGTPASPEAQTEGSSGMRPRIGASYFFASSSAPPEEKISTFSPQCGQTKPDMFSTMPTTGNASWSQNASERETSAAATRCGVVTTIAPSGSGSDWQTVSGSSPVPGGASTIR